MSVRWKPLIVLSGLFVAVALCGLLAFVFVSGQADAEEILAQARAAKEEGRFEEAEIYFLQASQVDPRRAETHRELSGFYDEWLSRAEPSKRPHLQGLRLRHLLEATKYDKTALEPRRALLAESLSGDNPAEQAHWAREVIALAPDDADALYVLAAEALDATPANVTEAGRIFETLKKVAPGRDRTNWIEARIAQASQDVASLDRILAQAAGAGPAEGDEELDQLCRLRLLVLGLERAEAVEAQAPILSRIQGQADLILDQTDLQANRVVELHRLSKRVRDALVLADADSAEDRWKALADSIDRGFKVTLEGDEELGLWVHQAFAEHLNLRGDRGRCLEVIQTALTPEVLKDASLQDDVMRMRETAIKAALADTNDADRFAKAGPHIEALIAGTRPEYQGLGHLFQGAIGLERSGLTGPGTKAERPEQGKALIAARSHLREATVKLPNVVMAKALYGIALMMSGETGLGRQHLLQAQRAEEVRPGTLEPRYQIWAAWSLLEAEYPEEAERIVNRLVGSADRDPSLAALAGTIRLLQGEIARGRRSTRDLEVARTAYSSALVDGEDVPPAVSLRLAELTIAMDGPEAGLAQLDMLRERGEGTPTLEALAVSTLIDLERIDEATATLDRARAQYPADPQLAVLDAAILLMQEQAEQAEQVLAAFLAEHPDELTVIETRARILASPQLNRVDEARSILSEAAERSGVTSPLIQLAMLDIVREDYDAASETVGTIRSRWPEASAADLLDAQICIGRRDYPGASRAFDAALKKDPSNKVALFWNAQLDAANGSAARAAEVLQAILRDHPVKELKDGVTLSTAAEWSLAELSMESRDFDAAIARLQSIVEDGTSESMTRAARWRLIAARAHKGDWPEAKKELIALLNEPDSTIDERVQAADFFRQNGESALAGKLVDQVLDHKPGHSGAVVLKAYLLDEEGRTAEAVDRLRSAIELGEQPPAVYLMLAAFAAEGDATEDTISGVRATLEDGLEVHPDSIDLTRTIYELIRDSEGVDAALAFAEEKAEGESDGDQLRRLLVDLYTREGRLDEAESLVETLLDATPMNARLASGLITIVSSKAVRAAREDRRKDEVELNGRTLALLQEFRERFPDDLRFPQAESELAMRQGDYARAEAVARQVEQINPDSPIGPLLRAQAYRDQGFDDRAIQAYCDALDQNAHRDDIRLVLGQLLLSVGRADEARVESERILERSPSMGTALLLKAASIVAQSGTAEQVAARQDEALALLRKAVEGDPLFSGAYLEIARIEHLRGNTPAAVATMHAAREAIPGDDQILSDLVRYLVLPPVDGSASGEGLVAEAEQIARNAGDGDTSGSVSLALALGFHRGGRPDLAQPWAERASGLLENPMVFTTHGDILLSHAESQDDPGRARGLLEEAVAMYDKVLAIDSKSIEAINNKAWILHRHFKQDREALELAEGLLGRVERRTLPAEFFDTLGSIQQAVGRQKDAEESFSEGLKQSPDLAVLNFHMGRLIAEDRERSARAGQYLARAWEARGQLSPEEIEELQTLRDRVGG
ncbi:tetratricopeptide repeat protein [Tautonia plasticadhaerens]|uniref:Tetratricopeptide repeat protein n=1 Tax=Tautonia plasticadhaerens TaxID=2527974 RepID=A0A518H8E2_9BACT|nr:tetratricopeptide repeat protein [Tautonia plasticadhaerens]QDV37118.1 tetratricopeptide repeat protein [Tautonia plasticadhaerens]